MILAPLRAVSDENLCTVLEKMLMAGNKLQNKLPLLLIMVVAITAALNYIYFDLLPRRVSLLLTNMELANK